MINEKNKTQYKTKKNKILTFICKYSILVNGIWKENGLNGWKTALAHARKYTRNLFDTKQPIIEILNLWTGEIITIEEAERRAKKAQLVQPCRP